MKNKKEKRITKEKLKQWTIDTLLIWMGCCVCAFGNIAIMIPNGLGTGGIIGVARLIQFSFNLNFALVNYALTTMVVIVTWIVFNFKEVRKILIVSILFPASLFLFEQFDLQLLAEKDLILASIFCGVFTGIGAGIVYSRGYSFGGTDTIAKMLRKRVWPQASQIKIMTAMNVAIIIGCAVIFGRNIALYALVTQWISSETIDLVLYGFKNRAVQVEIITEKGEEVCDYIINEMHRGVSTHDVEGAYTGVLRKELRLLCSPREEVELRRQLKKIDQAAFVTVVHVENVWGKGFESLDREE